MKLYDPAQIQPEQFKAPAPQQPEPKPFSYRFKNWWHYHKWYVIGGIALLLFLGRIAGNALGLWEKEPDLQIAYIAGTALPDDTVAALEQAFALLAGDFNRDGEAIVKVNQYVMAPQTSGSQAVYANYASEVLLMGDISACESYFFLTDDPVHLQGAFQILADSDGNCPDEDDVSVEDKVVLWADCSSLTGMDLGSYSVMIAGNEMTGDNQDLLSGLYLGRRYFYTDKTVDSLSQCNALWDAIISTKNRKG